MMGGDTTRNMYSSFPEINTLCKVISCWKHVKRNILTIQGPLNFKFIIPIWNKEELPEEWKESIIVPVYKKGDKAECSNYRGTTLLPTM